MATMSATMRGSSLRTAPFTAAVKAPVSRVSRAVLRVEANKKVAKKEKIILVRDLENVGKQGEIKNVPVGFWRNYLLPNGYAKVASDTILEKIRRDKENEIRKKLEEKAQAQAFANALATIGKFILKKKTGEKDQIYGSVSVSEVADAIYQQTGRNVSDLPLTLPEIKAVGTYECTLQVHPEVTATFSVVIQREKNLTIKTATEPAKKKK